MDKTKHQVGYSGKDSMREKAQKLFGNAVQGVDMTDVLSASAPSKTPMRKYAKGGHVKGEEKTMREGSMMPKSAKGIVQGGTLTDMHMPKKINTKAFKKGGMVRFEGEHADPVDNMHAKQTMKSKLSSMMKGTKSNAEHPKNADKEQTKIGIRGARQTKNTDAKETSETLKGMKMKEPKARTMAFNPGTDKQVGMPIPKRKKAEGFACGGKVSMPVGHDHGEYEMYKKGGSAVKAKVTSPMRKAVKGRTKNVDMSTKKGNVLDVGSVKQNATPKKKSMLHPKPASNGDKNSKLNVESVVKMNGMRCGGKAKK